MGKAVGERIGRLAGDEDLGRVGGGAAVGLANDVWGTKPTPAPAPPPPPPPSKGWGWTEAGIGLALGVGLALVVKGRG